MEDKIEVNEYVRTKDGIIDKVIIEYDGKCNNSNCNEKHISCKYNYYNEKDIVRHSKQLIDLIEVGDCIEYKELEIFTEKVGTKLRENYITDIHNNEELEDIKKEISNKKIKLLSILTKKQYMANCYKVVIK